MIWFESRDLDFFVLLLFSSLFFALRRWTDSDHTTRGYLACMHRAFGDGALLFFLAFSLYSPATIDRARVDGEM
jgi:hypothetical protein